MKGITRNPALVLIFSIISCGIYLLYWMYAISSELKYYLNDDTIKPGIDLLLSILCFPYMFYWLYKYSKLTTEAQTRAGVTPVSDNAVICVVLPFLGLSVVSALIIQNDLNKVWAS